MPRAKKNPEIKTEKSVKTAATKAKAAVKATAKKVDEKKTAEKIEVKKTAAKAKTTVKAKAEKVETAAKARPRKLEIVIQSPMGGIITPEEIAAKLPKGAKQVYVRVDQNKLWWINGEETGSVDIW